MNNSEKINWEEDEKKREPEKLGNESKL